MDKVSVGVKAWVWMYIMIYGFDIGVYVYNLSLWENVVYDKKKFPYLSQKNSFLKFCNFLRILGSKCKGIKIT
jgi:hypothetical protein